MRRVTEKARKTEVDLGDKMKAETSEETGELKDKEWVCGCV